MNNAARVRQRILAIFLPVTAVLYVSCEALDPKGTDQVVTTVAAGLKLLGIAAKHPTQRSQPRELWSSCSCCPGR